MRVKAYRSNDSRAVGSDQSGLILGLEHICNADHVVLWDPLGDADNERDLSLQCLLDTGSSERWWNENGRSISASCFPSLLDIRKHWLSEMLTAGLLWVGTTHNVGAIFNSLSRVESSLLASEALKQDLGLLCKPEVEASLLVARWVARRILWRDGGIWRGHSAGYALWRAAHRAREARANGLHCEVRLVRSVAEKEDCWLESSRGKLRDVSDAKPC